MGTVYDYLTWRGDLTFRKVPFGEVDSLILSMCSCVYVICLCVSAKCDVRTALYSAVISATVYVICCAMAEGITCRIGIVAYSEVCVIADNTTVSATVNILDIGISAHGNVGLAIYSSNLSSSVNNRSGSGAVNGNVCVSNNVSVCGSVYSSAEDL